MFYTKNIRDENFDNAKKGSTEEIINFNNDLFLTNKDWGTGTPKIDDDLDKGLSQFKGLRYIKSNKASSTDYPSSGTKSNFNKFKPINYIKTDQDFIIYSYGPNRKDDNGKILFEYDGYFKEGKGRGDIIFSSKQKIGKRKE